MLVDAKARLQAEAAEALLHVAHAVMPAPPHRQSVAARTECARRSSAARVVGCYAWTRSLLEDQCLCYLRPDWWYARAGPAAVLVRSLFAM